MDMSLFLLFLLSGLLCSTSAVSRVYHYINEAMSWSDAQRYCRERFTDLATVDSMADVNMMINLVNDGYSGSVWIGLMRGTRGRWGWSNGENTISQYSKWAIGEPNEESKGEFCAFIYNGFWYNVPCSRNYNFMCYDESTGYNKIEISKTWTEAQSYCRQYHNDLVTIRSAAEQNQITNGIGVGLLVWIGLFWDYWQWSDQWSLFFRNWDAGYTSQSSGFGDCVAMSPVSGKWIQSPCTEQHPFICFGDFKKQTVKLSLSHDGKYNLSDSSVQTAILNEISEKLKSIGLDRSSKISWRQNEGGEVFHLESKRATNITCDRN